MTIRFEFQARKRKLYDMWMKSIKENIKAYITIYSPQFPIYLRLKISQIFNNAIIDTTYSDQAVSY